MYQKRNLATGELVTAPPKDANQALKGPLFATDWGKVGLMRRYSGTRLPESSQSSLTLVTVFGRDACHLCDALRDELLEFQQTHDLCLDIEWVDIDSDPALARRYGLKVPVVTIGSTQVCHYFLDTDAMMVELELRGISFKP